MTRRFGLIGFPLGHSFSQKYFTEKFAKEGIDARYDLFPIENVSMLDSLMDSMPELCGLNVTIPYKEQVLPFIDEMTDEAESVGAVNVIKIIRGSDGRRHLVGFNSDTYGFTESIRPLIRPQHKKALVLGTGGASKAVVASLKRLGLGYKLVSRHPEQDQISYSDINKELLDEYKVIVNASPVGMAPNVVNCPVIPYEALNSTHLCFDLVYNPLETMFLRKASQNGAVVKNGLEMMHLQAERAWAFWNK